MFALSFGGEERKISVFTQTANFSLPVARYGGQDYVGLLELLEPMGTVSAKVDGKKWKFEFNGITSEFVDGKNHIRIRGEKLDLPADFVLDAGRGLIPVSGISQVLARFIAGPITFHEDSRRLLVGKIGVTFEAKLNPGNPPSLLLEFSSPVSPTIATEPGKLRMYFKHEALLPPDHATQTFTGREISSSSYKEENGVAEITLNGNAPLFASFGNGGRTISVTVAPQSGGTAVVANPAAPLPANPSIPLSGTGHVVAVIDASHGGSERGAALGDQLAEKDVTLAFARRLRQELESRGVSSLLLRDSDSLLTLDQRANLSNSAHPEIYLSIHAASQGNGIRIFTFLLPGGGSSKGPFLDWNSAQTTYQPASKAARDLIAKELQSKGLAVKQLRAALRPLNNITSAALAIEVAPQEGGTSDLYSPVYQQRVTSAIANAVALHEKRGGAH